uniref:Uncharacterized protein n=2 Tax=Anguilla anguilla TaxID=7936 RepID=A0A0E9S689_ANGAN
MQVDCRCLKMNECQTRPFVDSQSDKNTSKYIFTQNTKCSTLISIKIIYKILAPKMYQNEIQYFVYLKYKDTFLAPRFIIAVVMACSDFVLLFQHSFHSSFFVWKAKMLHW